MPRAVVILTAWLLFASSGWCADGPCSVGVIVPLTGNFAGYGSAVKNSVVLASERFATDGRVRFIFEDDQGTPKNTVSALTKLLRFDNISGLLVFGSTAAFSVSEIVEQKKIPTIAIGSVERLTRGKSFLMKHFLRASTENSRITAEVRGRHYQRVAMVTTAMEGAFELRRMFKESSPAQIVLDEEFPGEVTDFRATAARIARFKPDAVYVIMFTPQPGLFARELREAGYQGEIFATHLLEDLNTLKSAGKALEGAWFVAGDDRRGESYRAEYHRRFGSDPAVGGANAYDIARLFIQACFEKDINTYLHNVRDFQGVLGTYSATSENDFDMPVVIKEVRGGGFSFLYE